MQPDPQLWTIASVHVEAQLVHERGGPDQAGRNPADLVRVASSYQCFLQLPCWRRSFLVFSFVRLVVLFLARCVSALGDEVWGANN